MKNGITVQQPPAWGSRCATFGTDMSYAMSSDANQPWRRYMAPDRNPRLPNSRPRALMAVAWRRNRARLRKRWPSCVRSCTLTSKPRRLRSATSCLVETLDDHGASGTTWNDDRMPYLAIEVHQVAAERRTGGTLHVVRHHDGGRRPLGPEPDEGELLDAAPFEHEADGLAHERFDGGVDWPGGEGNLPPSPPVKPLEVLSHRTDSSGLTGNRRRETG